MRIDSQAEIALLEVSVPDFSQVVFHKLREARAGTKAVEVGAREARALYDKLIFGLIIRHLIERLWTKDAGRYEPPPNGSCSLTCEFLTVHFVEFETVCSRDVLLVVADLGPNGDVAGMTAVELSVALLLREGSLDDAISNHLGEIMRMLDGDAVAVLRGSVLVVGGRCPAKDEVRKLASCSIGMSSESVFATDRLGELYQLPDDQGPLAAGLLAISISRPSRGW